MSTVSSFVFGVLAVLLSLLGLILASGAEDGGIYLFGLSLFVGCALFVFWLIKKGFDAADAARAGHH